MSLTEPNLEALEKERIRKMERVTNLFYELLGDDPEQLQSVLEETKRAWDQARQRAKHALFNNEYFQAWLNELIGDGCILTNVEKTKAEMDAYLEGQDE